MALRLQSRTPKLKMAACFMRLPIPVLAAALALSCAFASANVISFPAENFSLDVPAGWISSPLATLPPPSRMIAAGRSPTNGNLYNVLMTGLPIPIAPESFLAGMQKPLIAKGWKASPIRDETIDGIPFAVFTMSRDAGPPFMLLATAFAENRIYVLQVVDPSGNVETAPELNGIVQSFRFLKPVHAVTRHEKTTGSQPYQIGYLVGRYVVRGAGLLVVLGVVVFLLVKAIKPAR